MKSIRQVRNLKGKRVLVRVDFNVPIKNGDILDDTKLKATLPTVKYLIEKKAKVILLTHLGRPEGKLKVSLKVDPVMHQFSKMLGKKIRKLETENWRLSTKKKIEILSQLEKMKPGRVVMMGNIRFSSDEKDDTGILSQELANLADIFVLDGFAVAHRASASVVGVAKFIPAYAGLLLEKEVKSLNRIIKKPKKPFVLVLGRIKIETKIPVIKNLLPKTNNILIGGGLVNTFLKAKGYGVGDSLVDKNFLDIALKFCSKRQVIKPVDLVVGRSSGKHFRIVEIKNKPHKICKKQESIFDIGPKTIEFYKEEIDKAKNLVWNGALGYFEQKPYDVGTLTIARLIAERSKRKDVFGLAGGGETIQSMKIVSGLDKIDFVSTGGGAMLEYLSGKKLSGISALEK